MEHQIKTLQDKEQELGAHRIQNPTKMPHVMVQQTHFVQHLRHRSGHSRLHFDEGQALLVLVFTWSDMPMHNINGKVPTLCP
jgi:hypothetical protein